MESKKKKEGMIKHMKEQGMDTTMMELSMKDHNDELTVKELACALYEGTPHLQNLAEKLARQHGKAGALSFFGMMGEDIQNFWMSMAQQMINHAKQWGENEGSACVLSKFEQNRLKHLPRVDELKEYPISGDADKEWYNKDYDELSPEQIDKLVKAVRVVLHSSICHPSMCWDARFGVVTFSTLCELTNFDPKDREVTKAIKNKKKDG